MVTLTVVLASGLTVFAATDVQVTAPNGGESYNAGATINVTWVPPQVGEASIFYSVDSGTNWIPIQAVSDMAYGASYPWTLPDIASTKVRVKIKHTYTTMGSGFPPVIVSKTTEDTSDADFTIKKFIIAPLKPIDPLLPLNFKPTAPVNLNGQVDSVSELTLNWEDKSSNESGFQLERKTGSGVWSLVAERVADAESYQDTGLIADTQYTYRVRAVNSYGNSDYSNELQMKTEAAVPGTTVVPEIPSTPATPGSAVEIRLYVGSMEYYVNSKLNMMDTAPVVREGRTLLPIRYVADAIGADVKWLAEERKTTVTLNGKTIEMWIDKNMAKVDGQAVMIDPANAGVAPVILPPGRTMLPVRFVLDNLGCDIGWDPSTQEVKVKYPK